MILRRTEKIKEDDPYTPSEWQKIRKLALEKGKIFKSKKSVLKYLHKSK